MLFKKDWLVRMEYKLRRYSVRNLMAIIVFGMAFVFIADMAIITGMSNVSATLSDMLKFEWHLILSGEVWRVISFVFIPPSAAELSSFSIFFAVIALYFYWIIGSPLENYWGTFKFNIFYFCGVICAIVGGIITDSTTNYYLNLSLFLAFAIIHPNFEFLLFFMLPLKVKYLAYLDLAFLLFNLIMADMSHKIAIVASLINIVLFFGGDIISGIKHIYRRAKWKRDAGNWFR
jgi:hypothetical protein